ncbi:MAG: ParB/RepB/Spo0J family partition protein [Schlesneria sp.]
MIATVGKLKVPKATKAKSETNHEVLETDDELLKISLSYGGIKKGSLMSDADLLGAIIKRWGQAKVHTRRPYMVSVKDPVFGVAIWYSNSNMGHPAHFFDPDDQDEGDQGRLLEEVRRVLSIDLPTVENTTETVDPAFAAVKAKGKSRAKKAEPATSAGDLLQGVIVVEERDVDYDEIVRSKQNPRHDFDADLIAQMKPNIVTICQVNPLTIREGSNELIDGETRHRAGDGVAKALRCKIIRCTDAQAALMRLQTSMQRRDLNSIEKAQALADMLDKHGMTQRQLTEIVKMEQSTIDNFTRLLKLPDNWKQQLISGEITATSARELVPWIDEKKVLDEVLKEVKKIPVPNRSTAVSETLKEVAWKLSRPIEETVSSGHPNYRHAKAEIKLTPELRKQLRVKSVKHWSMSKERAFNVEAWHPLMQAAKAKALESLTKKDQKSATKDGKVDPKRAAENAKKQKEMLQKKLYRYKIDWLQAQLANTIETASIDSLTKYLISFCLMNGNGGRQHDVQQILGITSSFASSENIPKIIPKIFGWNAKEMIAHIRTLLVEWLIDSFDGTYDALSPGTIEQFAKFADVDLKKDWPASCKSCDVDMDPLNEYLLLLSKDQLIDLIAEWNLSVPSCNSAKRGDLISAIAEIGRGKPAPKSLLEVQPIRLK